MRRPTWTDFVVGTPAQDATGSFLYVNSRYQVAVKRVNDVEPFGRIAELSIKTRDKSPIMDWRDMQKIKNDFCGKETTMLQVFPPESRLVDTSNQYYFFVLLDYKLPFGFKERLVSDESGIKLIYGHDGVNNQRPFDDHHVPETFEDDKARARELYDKIRAATAPVRTETSQLHALESVSVRDDGDD